MSEASSETAIKKVWAVCRDGGDGCTYSYSEPFKVFEDQEDAELYCDAANKEHNRLVSQYAAASEKFRNDWAKWHSGKHKVKPMTGPMPEEPRPPINKYDPDNDDWSWTVGENNRMYSTISYSLSNYPYLAKGEWQDGPSSQVR